MGRGQLLGLGLDQGAIRQRLETKRLHEVRRGVYAVGRPELSLLGQWMGAVLSCGETAVLSDRSAAELWEIVAPAGGGQLSSAVVGARRIIHVSIRHDNGRDRSDLVLHRRASMGADQLAERYAIPVTTPIATLVDLAGAVDRGRLTAAVNEADKRGLVDRLTLAAALDSFPRRPGRRALRRLLARSTLLLTDSELERLFLGLVEGIGLPTPRTQVEVNGYRVDFFWPDLGLVVETDGLTYHRTPEQQANDRERDQVHTAAGLTCLRFTHGQVRDRSGWVEATLRRVVGRLASG